MRLRRFALLLLGAAAVVLVAVLPAAGKDGVRATLKTSIRLDAPAGTQLDVAWTLAYVDDDGKRQPFGAGGLFVRLVSASGAQAETAFASGDSGTYRATIAVPEGGIGDIEVGLVGWQSGANGTRRADAIFPITNDPLPDDVRAAAPTAAPAASGSGDGGSTSWILILVTGSLVMTLVAVALLRRRPLGRFG